MTCTKFWRPIDSIGRWLGERLGAQNQLRLGIVCFLASIPFYGYMPFSGEPAGVYLMSALALTLTGVGLVIGAQILLKQVEQEES